jgi:hypothetical protein
VQVHYDEGIANRIDPESCAVAREGLGEALTGDYTGQPLSREMNIVLGADTLSNVEGNTNGSAIASARTARRGRRPWHVWTLLAREPGDLTVGQRRRYAVLVRIGKARSRSR